MSSNALSTLVSESTPAGEQTLVPGVAPISQRQRLDALLNAPLTPVPATKTARHWSV